ncbi:MAG: glycosyl hydrolase [Solirubrobacteraceae bacterium]
MTLVGAAPASAKYRVGIGEQKAAVFDSPSWQSLKLKRIRYLVPWDYAKHSGQRDEVDHFMGRAREAKQDVLVTFTARRGCYIGNRYSRKKACRAPSTRKYRKAYRAFDKQFPWVRTYSAWNEINHKSQPTFKSPRKAAGYYNVLRKDARRKRFRVMAADMLDTGNMGRYLSTFKRYAKGSPKLWGLHNYGDVNRKRTRYTKQMLRSVRGEVWLTETGGIVKLLPSFKRSPSRAAKRTKGMFRLVNRYDTKRRGMRSKITRLFVYTWFGEERSARFDAGLVNPDGSPRKAFSVFSKNARKHR